jgi:hypothetical protein
MLGGEGDFHLHTDTICDEIREVGEGGCVFRTMASDFTGKGRRRRKKRREEKRREEKRREEKRREKKRREEKLHKRQETKCGGAKRPRILVLKKLPIECLPVQIETLTCAVTPVTRSVTPSKNFSWTCLPK